MLDLGLRQTPHSSIAESHRVPVSFRRKNYHNVLINLTTRGGNDENRASQIVGVVLGEFLAEPG